MSVDSVGSMKTPILLALLAGALFVAPARASTALEALRLIPDADLDRLAIIDGHDGTPTPERWHFLFYDPTAENGLREYVIQNGRIAAEREVSQFAPTLHPGDAVGIGALSIDSDVIARSAQRFAKANGHEIASMNFAMRKDEESGGALWSVVCVNSDGRAFASLVMTGDQGRIVSHEGFPTNPAAVAAKTAERKAATKTKSRVTDAQRYERRPPPVYQGPENEDYDVPVRRAERVRRNPPRLPDPIDDVVKPLHRLVRGLLPF